MQPLSCPIPSNINPLQSNGFMFSVNKLPEISFFCQEVNVPAITLPSADVESPLIVSPMPGEKMSFNDLTVTFMIDEEMTNYVAIYNWIVGLGFQESHAQYRELMAQRIGALAVNELMAGYSDGSLTILNSANNAIRTVRFVDMFPTSLSSIQLQSTTTDTMYLAGVVDFKYTYYYFD